MIEPLLYGRDLDGEQAHSLMVYLTTGEATDAQIGAVVSALRVKTCTATELAGFASVLREQSLGPKHDFHDLVDTCGTGGGAPSFNISTAAAFVSAACGVRIAKHGNRGVTSAYGSADVLETLGAKIQTEESVLLRMLDKAFHLQAQPFLLHVAQSGSFRRAPSVAKETDSHHDIVMSLP